MTQEDRKQLFQDFRDALSNPGLCACGCCVTKVDQLAYKLLAYRLSWWPDDDEVIAEVTEKVTEK